MPDFPSKGVIFRDITPLLQHGPAFRDAILALAALSASPRPDVVVAIESRGLIIGAALAQELGVGIVPIRKAGKLPLETYRASYRLEYGEGILEIHQDALTPGSQVLLVDDLLATGGTLGAAIRLVEQCGGQIQATAVLIELPALKGREQLVPHPVTTLMQF